MLWLYWLDGLEGPLNAPLNWFHGFYWFLVSTKGYKETAPWKRKFRFSVKLSICLKPCVCLKSEIVNIENEDATGKKVLNFSYLAFQNEKMDWEWTDLPLWNIPPSPFIRQPPCNKNILTKNPKFQKFLHSLTLTQGAQYGWRFN